MSVSLTIHPLHEDLDMFGVADSACVLFMFTMNFANFVISSAYALSGHVSISITSPYSLFEARRPAHLLLQSVTLTFEGQTEIFTTSTGYSAVRLCTVTRELVPGEPIELSNAGHDLSEPCK